MATPPTPAGKSTPPTGLAAVVARVMRLRPVRVFARYSERRGPLLAAGLSYQAIFAVFAALWVTFAVVGTVFASTPELRDPLFATINSSVPGLIDTGSGGAIDPDMLLGAGVLGWTGAFALVGLVFTTLGWFASGRDAVRIVVGLPPATVNVVLLKLRDAATAIVFGLVVLGSAALSVASTAALGATLDWLGIDSTLVPAILAARGIGLLLAFVIDGLVLFAFIRVVAGVRLPLRAVIRGILLGAAALGVLKGLGSSLLGSASSNPLLASFAVLIGLLVWFNLVCQVILLSAAWISVDSDDRHIAVEDETPPDDAPAAPGSVGGPR